MTYLRGHCPSHEKRWHVTNEYKKERKKERINENELSNIGELSTSRLELNGKGRNESV